MLHKLCQIIYSDNIKNCPCMERCFFGSPCRVLGEFAHFGQHGHHADFDSGPDVQPTLATGTELEQPVTLFWSDEFGENKYLTGIELI